MFRRIICSASRANVLFRYQALESPKLRLVSGSSKTKTDSVIGERRKTQKKVDRKLDSKELGKHLKDTKKVMSLSKSLEKQKEIFSDHIVKAKPLSNRLDVLRWRPFYFRDFDIDAKNSKMSQVLQKFEEDIVDSCRAWDVQERSLLVLIQASGYGKTHLVYQYCLKHRALLTQFLQGVNGTLYKMLELFILNLQNKLKIPDKSVASIETEQKFTRIAFQATSLVPLTCIEFADHFFKIASNYFSEEQLNEALLRTIHNGPRTMIDELFQKNLKLYATNQTKFEAFKKKMYRAAAGMKLEAMIYDEVLAFNTMPGMFLHHPFTAEPAYARLEQERQFKGSVVQLDGPYNQITSVLYLLRIAMEDLVKNASIPQVCLATHFSARHFEQLPTKPGDLSRDRLKVKTFYWTESAEERWRRFQTELTDALNMGNAKEAILDNVENLKYFAVRPTYLWPFWTTLSGKLQNKSASLEQIVKEALKEHQENTKGRVREYVSNILQPDKIEWRDHFLTQVVLGRRYILGNIDDLGHLLKTGLIPLPAGLETFIDGRNSTRIKIPLSDPFTLQQLEEEAQRHLDRLLEKIAHPMNSLYDAGLFGEAFAFSLLLRNKGLTLAALALPDIGLDDNPVLSQFAIGENFYLRDYEDLELANDGNFFTNSFGYSWGQDYILKPSNSLRPDMVMFPVNNEALEARQHTFTVGLNSRSKVQAVLCIQSKFHATPMTPSLAEEAIDTLDPNQFYIGKATTLRASWEKMKSQVTTPHYWIRAISGRAVSQSVKDAVKEHNIANPFQPILLFTPELIPNSVLWKHLSNVAAPRQGKAKSTLPATKLKLNRFFDSTILDRADEAKFKQA